MKTMKDYLDLDLKCYVLLLADMFEKIRKNTLKNYGLRPSHYLSAPGLSWDAMLKITKIKFELIPNPDMYIFFENGTRAGPFNISNRYSKTNNKYLIVTIFNFNKKPYDPKHKPKHAIYFDANNLDCYAMSKFLPTSGFKWIDPKEFNLNKYTNNNLEGYIL